MEPGDRGREAPGTRKAAGEAAQEKELYEIAPDKQLGNIIQEEDLRVVFLSSAQLLTRGRPHVQP